MKEFLVIVVISVFYPCFANCQEVAKSDSCNLFNTLKFRNGIDTILVRGTLIEMGMWPPGDSNLKKLEKEGKLKEKDFSYAVGFIPDNCTKQYYIASRDTSKIAKSLFNPKCIGTHILVICIVFENYKLWSYPFFIIDKIERE